MTTSAAAAEPNAELPTRYELLQQRIKGLGSPANVLAMRLNVAWLREHQPPAPPVEPVAASLPPAPTRKAIPKKSPTKYRPRTGALLPGDEVEALRDHSKLLTVLLSPGGISRTSQDL